MSDADDRDMLAAEYVLGTLDATEREEVAASLVGDADLARAVRAWEDRLAPLVERVPDVPPPADAYARIAARLFGTTGRPATREADGAGAALLRSVRRWQAATAGFALVAASLLALVAVRETGTVPGRTRFTAVLQRDAGAPVMLVDVDLAARRLTVRPFAAAAPTGHAYELWLVDPGLGAPRSLGVVPVGDESQQTLGILDASIVAGATYAVTVEPSGGSPTGRPTTAPILSGKLSSFPS